MASLYWIAAHMSFITSYLFVYAHVLVKNLDQFDIFEYMILYFQMPLIGAPCFRIDIFHSFLAISINNNYSMTRCYRWKWHTKYWKISRHFKCRYKGHRCVWEYGTNLSRPWWRHQMETFSALLALCAGNSSVTGEFPPQRPVTQSFGVWSAPEWTVE